MVGLCSLYAAVPCLSHESGCWKSEIFPSQMILSNVEYLPQNAGDRLLWDLPLEL